MLAHFYKADAQYGARLAKALGVDVALVHQRATSLLE
jgi:catalase